MVAVIKTGGKQYVVAEGETIAIEKLEGAADTAVIFDEVLLIGDDKDVTLGAPMIKGAHVDGKIIEQTRAKKVWGMKYKAKKRYRIKFGHKQPLTKVEITKIAVK